MRSPLEIVEIGTAVVPGQVISKGIIEFMRNLDVKEIHGYHTEVGIKVLKMPKA